MHPLSVPCTTGACRAQSPTSGAAGHGCDGAVPQGEQFVYHEDWGEALSTRSVPVICVLDLEGSSLTVLEGIPEHLSAGQVRTGCRGRPRRASLGLWDKLDCRTGPVVPRRPWRGVRGLVA